MDNTVSVVIPIYNEKENLAKCLSALFETKDKDFEVVIVNDGSTDNPHQLLKQYPCRAVDLPVNKNQAYARNIGVKESKGDIILFTDADCLVMQDWVKSMRDELIKSHNSCEDIVALCGRLVSGKGFFQMCHGYSGYAYVQQGQRRFTDILNTACTAIYKKAFWDVGGFSEDLKVSEDPDLALKLVEHGKRIIFEPSLFVLHNHGIKTFRGFMAKHKAWGKELGLKLVLKHKERNKILLPLFLNPITHFFLVVPVAFLTTIKIFACNIRYDKKLLLYSFFIFLSKIVYRWEIFIQSIKRRK